MSTTKALVGDESGDVGAEPWTGLLGDCRAAKFSDRVGRGSTDNWLLLSRALRRCGWVDHVFAGGVAAAEAEDIVGSRRRGEFTGRPRPTAAAAGPRRKGGRLL